MRRGPPACAPVLAVLLQRLHTAHWPARPTGQSTTSWPLERGDELNSSIQADRRGGEELMGRSPSSSSDSGGCVHAALWMLILAQIAVVYWIWSSPAAAVLPSHLRGNNIHYILPAVQHVLPALAADAPSPTTLSPPAQPLTILVVLGNMPLDDATPTIDTMTRVQTAVKYYTSHIDKEPCLLVFSGGKHYDEPCWLLACR